MPDTKRISVSESGDAMVVEFTDHMVRGAREIDELGQQLYALVSKDQPVRIILDFSGVEFLSSAALGKLISLNRRVNEHHGKLVLCDMSDGVSAIITLTRLDAVLTIVESREAALVQIVS